MAVRNRRLARLAPFALLAVVHTWPLASAPGRLSRLDNADTALNTFIVSWVAHQAPRDPLGLFDAPIFHPERNTLAYSEHMAVPALMGAPMLWAGADPVLVYNLLILAGFALSGWSMCVLIARWTGSEAAGLVAGALFAFNAHLLTRLPHLQALHVEFLPLALLAFDAVVTHGRWRDAMALAGVFALQALCSNYTLVFLSLALIVSLAVRPEAWIGRAREVWPPLVAAALVAVAVVLPFLWPYYVASRDQGLVRSMEEVALYAAGPLDYLTTAGRLHYDLWSHRFFEGRTALFPGGTAVLLAAAAGRACWRNPRARMALSFGLAGVALSFGPALPGYAWLHDTIPLLQGVRGVARWGFLGLTAVAILAGFGTARIDAAFRDSPYRAAVLVALLGLVTIEALRAPMGYVAWTGVPAIYSRLRAEPRGPVIEMPIHAEDGVAGNGAYLVPAATHFRPLVNGYSGFQPSSYVERARVLRTLPSPEAIALLRDLRVAHLIVHGDAPARDVLRAPDFELIAEVDGARLYRVVFHASASRPPP